MEGLTRDGLMRHRDKLSVSICFVIHDTDAIINMKQYNMVKIIFYFFLIFFRIFF